MLGWLEERALAKVFGGGFGAEIAARGTTYLETEIGKAIDREEQHLTTVRLKPGESYTVVARPRATKVERSLSGRRAKLAARNRKLSRPSRKQLRAARKLARSQRRLDRRKPGSRRFTKVAVKEHRRARRFDHVMMPTRPQIEVRAELAEVSARLAGERARTFGEAKAKRSLDRRQRRSEPDAENGSRFFT